MSLAEVMAEYPSIVLSEPSIAALAKQVRELCKGSPYERGMVDWYVTEVLEKLDVDKRGLMERWRKRAEERQSELFQKCVEELKREFGRTATEDELSSLAATRHSQVAGTLIQFIDKALDLNEAFCKHTEYLAGPVIDVHAAEFEKSLDPKIDKRMKAWFNKQPGGMAKAVFQNSLFDREATLNDLEEVEKRE